MNDSFDATNKTLKDLHNPPEEYSYEYEVAMEAADSLNNFVSLAKNPSGSYRSYSQDTNQKDSEMASDIQKLGNIINE